MTVFVPQNPLPNPRGFVPDLSSAAQYGPLEFVFTDNERVHALPTPSINKARRVLKNFDADNDFILWPGSCDPSAWAAMILALGELGLDRVRLLQWSRKRDPNGVREYGAGFYVPITFNLKEVKHHDGF